MFERAGLSRRDTLRIAAAMGGAAVLPPLLASPVLGQEKGERPEKHEAIMIVNPRTRVPVSFIIDDSTCLVNLAHYCIPQFASVFPDNYKQDWRKLPREIPDSFVRKFGEWCREHGVKGKYSIVPYPACVGWIDREMPGWTRRELEESLTLVRDFMTVDWDIHPEMVTHTWAINTKTGRPYEPRTQDFMENWGFSVGKSVDEMADYLAYALRLLKNVGLPCEGVTTPGGFGNKVIPALSQGTLEAVRDVFAAEIPHYFRFLFTDHTSVVPRVEYASQLSTHDPRCVVSIIGCTGDWFGGWDGLEPGKVTQFISDDLQEGRMVDVIECGEPAIMVSHWAGIYFNGEEVGFNIFREVVRRLHLKFDNLLWMKPSEIARYWAAKELTSITQRGESFVLRGPFACPAFTFSYLLPPERTPNVTIAGQKVMLSEVQQALQLKTNCWHRENNRITLCLDLPRRSEVVLDV